MNSLAAALVAVLLLTVVAFLGLSYVGFDRSNAAQIAAGTIATVPYFREIVQRIRRRSNRDPVVALGDYGIPPGRMILYGTLVVIGAMEFASGVGGLSAIFVLRESRQALGETGTFEAFKRMLLIAASLIQFPIIFGVGRWVGRRSAAHDIAVLVLISFLARLSTTLADVWLAPGVIKRWDIDVTPGRLSLFVAAGTVLFFLIGLIGYWRGRGQRLAAYLTYLLQNVSKDTRKAIVDLAFEEARATPTRGILR